MPLCHVPLIQQRKSSAGGSGCLTSPSRLVCCTQSCAESSSRTGWAGGDLQRLPHPSTVSTSAPTSVISVRDIITSPGFTPQDTKWGRWDLRAHPAAAPCHEQGHCHQTRLPKPMHHSQGCPALGLCRCSLSHCRCSVPLSQARPCPPGAPWGAGMLWDGMNEAQGKEPLTQQERAGEWELTKKKNILKLSWLCSDYFTLFTKI